MTEASARPGGVKALCVIAIVLGSLGLLGVLLGIGSQLANPKVRPPLQDPKLAELNAEWERRVLELNRDAKPGYWVFLPLSGAASGLLLVGGVLGLKGRRRSLFNAALGASIVVDVVAAGLGISMHFKTMDVMEWYFREAGSAGPSPSSGMTLAMFVPLLVLSGGWLLLKGAYYAWGLLHLRKPAVRAFFGEGATSSAPAPSSPPTAGASPS